MIYMTTTNTYSHLIPAFIVELDAMPGSNFDADGTVFDLDAAVQALRDGRIVPLDDRYATLSTDVASAADYARGAVVPASDCDCDWWIAR
jgi:hypothetical protein